LQFEYRQSRSDDAVVHKKRILLIDRLRGNVERDWWARLAQVR
jgi:hypothetical protein